MVVSKVGRMGSTFYTLTAHDDQRLAYVWQRALHTDMPNVPPRQRLEFYELWNGPIWMAMFGDCTTVIERVTRFREYVEDGDITLRRLNKSSPMHKVNVYVYDGQHIVIDTPPKTAELVDIGDTGMTFPKSLTWSNLVVKEHYRLATTHVKEEIT